MTLTHRPSHVLAATLACALLAACSGGNEVADLTTVAPSPSSSAPVAVTTTETEPSVVASTEAATTVPDTTIAPETTVANDGLTGPTFSDALGVKVDSAPGVRTRGDTRQLLPEGLYVHIAWEPDPQDPSVFTVQPDDVEILEAYANAVTTYYRAALSTLTLDDPDFARYITDPQGMFGGAFTQALLGDFVLDIGVGVILRPYIVDHTDEGAVVYDCYLQDEVYIPRGSNRPPTELSPRGQVVTMVASDGAWKAETAGPLGSACL